jgi:phosphoglycerate dehydrogenase-like enzyme
MQNTPVVLVTQPEYRRGEPVFASTADLRCVATQPDERSLCEAIAQQGARYIVVGSVPYGDALYAAMPRGGVIARFGVGHDTIDKPKATLAGLMCTNTPDVLQQSVAELTMLLIGAAARHLVPMANDMREGKWVLRQGTELQGKTLAIVGCGVIGQAVARIAAVGYGMRVIGFRRKRANAGPEHRLEYFDSVTDDFGAAVAHADFVSLHIPGSTTNKRFLDSARLARIPERAWLVNTARGSVADEAALFDALQSGRLAGAALDVFEREPYEPSAGRDLRTLPNVILVPHVGSHTADANRRMAQRAIRNIRLAHAGDVASMDLLNKDVLQV